MVETAKQIAKESKSSFYYAFNLLPTDKRDAMNTVYAFCRKTDDIVDEGNDSTDLKYEQLHKWRVELENSIKGNSNYQLLNKLAKIVNQFNIPIDPFFELIKGMEMDLQKKRYETFEELQLYCYRVASTVGLMCIEIFGYNNPSTKDFAVNLGIALQMTNILRDVKKDAEKNRIYLPLEDINRFQYTEEELISGTYNNNFIALMEFETVRAKDFFNKANSALDLEDKASMYAARAMQHIYYKLLEKIVSNRYNVLQKNIKVSKFEKVGISLGVWAKYNLVY